MSKERNFIDKILLFLKGLSMGAANKVPGVSGGTVAFVLDFYEELSLTDRQMRLMQVVTDCCPLPPAWNSLLAYQMTLDPWQV